MQAIKQGVIQKTRSGYDGDAKQKVVHVNPPRDLGNYICNKGFRESISTEKAAAQSVNRKARKRTEQDRP